MTPDQLKNDLPSESVLSAFERLMRARDDGAPFTAEDAMEVLEAEGWRIAHPKASPKTRNNRFALWMRRHYGRTWTGALRYGR